MRKPLFPLDPIKARYYYPGKNFTETGSEGCDKLDPETIEDEDVKRMFLEVETEPIKQVYRWMMDHRDEFAPTTLVLGLKNNGRDPIPERENGEPYHAILVQRPLHTVYELDIFLANVNRHLSEGGYLVCNCRTSSVKKAVIYRRYPRGINRLYYGFHYVWHRVFPKIKGLKNIYFAVTKGRNRTFHRVEILGRLYHAGFEVVYESTAHGEFRVIARKMKDPISEGTPSSSPIAKLERVGKNGKIISQSVEEYVTTGDASVLKRKMETALMNVLRSVKWDMFSLGPIIGYLMGREAEAKALRVIFGAKRGGFDYELPELYA